MGINLYDYGARWYDAAVGRWTSVDPLAEKYVNSGTSSYAYTWNNPVIFIDPTGRQGEDTYGVNSDGYIVKIDDKKYYDENGKEVDMLVSGHKLRYYRRGRRKGQIKNDHIMVEKGRLRAGAKKNRPMEIGGKPYEYTHMVFGNNDSGAKKLFSFLAEETDVEWSIYQIDRKFAKQTEIFSSHMHDKEVVGASFLMDKLKANVGKEKLIYHMHSHPPTYKMGDESGLEPSYEDIQFAKGIRQIEGNESARFFIHFGLQKREY